MPTIRTNDVETYYEVTGDGPPVVFVHAAILDHSQWDQQVAALRDEYTTVVYDLRGHGRTGGSTPDEYSIELFADDLDALISGLDLDAPVVCALSTGGCIAQVYAARYPDRLSGLLLADTFTPTVYDWLERIQRSLVLRATLPMVRVVGYQRVERAMVWLQERIAGERAGGDYQNVQAVRASGPSMSTDEFAKTIRAILAFERSAVDLSAITVPTLVVHGEHELAFVRRHAATLATEISDASVQVVPDAGHASNLDNPAAFERALRDLLARVRRNGGFDDWTPNDPD